MPTVKCKICGNNFYIKPSHQKLGWGKYCSVDCRSKAQLRGKKVVCFICGKSIYRSLARLKQSKSKHFFCSKSCQTRWRNSYFKEERHSNWSGGMSVYRKILARNHAKQICAACGIKDKRVLVAHHIDHNRQNNNRSNLVWTCHNCHFLIHHDKNLEINLKNTILT